MLAGPSGCHVRLPGAPQAEDADAEHVHSKKKPKNQNQKTNPQPSRLPARCWAMWALVFIGSSPGSRSASPVAARLGCRPQGAAGSGESRQGKAELAGEGRAGRGRQSQQGKAEPRRCSGRSQHGDGHGEAALVVTTAFLSLGVKGAFLPSRAQRYRPGAEASAAPARTFVSSQRVFPGHSTVAGC